MKQTYLTIILVFILVTMGKIQLNAQNQVTIKGKLVDTINYTHLEYSSISAIRAADSILVNFTRANDQGEFELKVPTDNEYILMFVHPDMATLILQEEIKSTDKNLGTVYLSSKAFVLEELVVIGQRAITIKGDTTEYSVDSFKVREFANVDELLKKLPGIEVDAQGNIYAHGEKVQRMLVDGDEFFSDDPAVLAKMLRASSVNKVQVYDAKTEDAQFTGVDDGTRIKTINLKLKDNAKQGYFGKVDLGGALPGYWENLGMFNYFKNKRKLSLFGVMSNTSRVGLSFSETQEMTGGSMFTMEDGMIAVASGLDIDSDFGGMDGSFSGRGLPKTVNGGFHFGDRFGNDQKNEASLSYRINSNSIISDQYARNHYILPDTQYVHISNQEQTSSALNHSLSARTKIEFDSTSNMSITFNGKMSNARSTSESYAYNADIHDIKANESSTFQTADRENKQGSASVSYRKRFSKPGRSMIIAANGQYSSNHSKGDFLSNNKFFISGDELVYNQIKDNSTENITGKLEASYTEPLSDMLKLVIDASAAYQDAAQDQLTYDRVGGVDTLNNLFSSSYRFAVSTYAGGFRINYKIKNWTLNLGSKMAHTTQLHENLFLDTIRKYSFVNVFPSASLNYNANNRYISFNYNGASIQPTIDQLQPLIQNTNPLYIRIGNPELKQQFVHNFGATMSKFNPLSQSYYYVYINGSYTSDAISTSQSLEANGVSIYKPINVDYAMTANTYLGYSTKIPGSNFRLGGNLALGLSQNQNELNNILTTATTYNINPGVNIDYSKDTVMDISFRINGGYTNSFTDNSTFNNDFLSLNTRLNATYNFSKGWSIGTDAHWQLREKMGPDDPNANLIIWNAFVSKTFLKDRSMIVSLNANDILNQNVGFSRYTTNNLITETQYNTIRQYVMLKLSWNFTHSAAMGKGSVENQDSDIDLSNPDNYQEQ